MEQLIKITSIPIEYELRVDNARLEMKRGTAELEITREKGGGLQIKSKPIKLRLDNFEMRNSISPSVRTSIANAAAKGRQDVYETIAKYARRGQYLLAAKPGDKGAALQQMWNAENPLPSSDFQLTFTPRTGPKIDWEEPSLTIHYEMDKLHFDAKIEEGVIEFIPGDIQLTVLQYPEVLIEYIGDAVYVTGNSEQQSGEQIDARA
ncbi:hypothetical protein M2145_000426 [Lachnospiraceae bacterium PF1-21]|uniref:DUF6470 family protein n=1 Tax=Ohessyouella blattaphilus TaxID=2949333 RepID=A0ABT1EHH9_9FIRM|nr:DUF6470 family protein [Ohessyouella blattaphilus]MCP1109156.1 DUF6470 family protein [Ohessyouella blattaphilus]MCR8562550.1 DUF6470 family protein [Ohessyouella blattaphilus]MDL2250258.1 DUF6470 family protein [Lachnospiraceae bacterium OttesenSCG-928-J05]